MQQKYVPSRHRSGHMCGQRDQESADLLIQDDSITRGGGRANFPKHLQAFKGTPAVSWNALRPDCVDPPFLFTFKTQALFSLSCVYSWSFLKNILRLIGLHLTADLHMGKEHIRSNYKCCK